MSISNSTRAIAHVSVTSALLGLNDSQYKRRIVQVEGKEHSYRKSEQQVQNAAEKTQDDNSNSFSSAAHEIYSTVSSTFHELMDLTQHRLNPIAFSKINSASKTSFNNVDLKRHQNYFNQMMNFDTPSGNWVDVSG